MTRDDVLERDSVLDERAFYLQAAFRALLDATARPGELCELPEPPAAAAEDAAEAGLLPATVTVCDVLLDAATSVAVAGEGGADARRVLSRRSHVRPADESAAAYVVVPLGVRGEEAAAVVGSLTSGTLLDPHLGATCVVECATLVGRDRSGARTGSASGAAPARRWRLSGPGIAQGELALVECDRSDVVSARQGRSDEFPCGIDLVLVDGAGHVLAVPRTTSVERDATALPGEGVGSWAM